jgi:hypothetical protein
MCINRAVFAWCLLLLLFCLRHDEELGQRAKARGHVLWRFTGSVRLYSLAEHATHHRRTSGSFSKLPFEILRLAQRLR